VRQFEAGKDAIPMIAFAISVLRSVLCFGAQAKMAFRQNPARGLRRCVVIGLSCVAVLTGCMKAYDKPEFVEADTSETGFLIPLEGDAGKQEKFQSEGTARPKVATKRVQIVHRWSQEGRMPTDGRWIATVRLVKVNRSPVTRTWTTAQNTSAGSVRARSDPAIWIESGEAWGSAWDSPAPRLFSEEEAARVSLLVSERFAGRGDLDHEVRGASSRWRKPSGPRKPLTSAGEEQNRPTR